MVHYIPKYIFWRSNLFEEKPLPEKLLNFKKQVKVPQCEETEELQRRVDLFFYYLNSLNFEEITEGLYSANFIAGLLNLFMSEQEIGVVVDEIKHLQMPNKYRSRTKPPTKFKHSPLKGLWHKHYFPGDIRSIAMNIISGLNAKGGLRKVIGQVCSSSGENVFTPQLINKLAHEVTEVPFSERAEQEKITGEWIIFHEFEGKNYFLAISNHTTQIEDEKLAEMISTFSKVEFPELKNSLEIFEW